MLPLTEGSLRLRADDEDSLTSEDSFFSATEVTGGGHAAGSAEAPAGPALCYREMQAFCLTGAEFGRNQVLLPGDSVKLQGTGRPDRSGVVGLVGESRGLALSAPADIGLLVLQPTVFVTWH